jgi:hypothetical protein
MPASQFTLRGFMPAEIHSAFRNAAVLMVAFTLMIAVATRYTDYSDTGTQIHGPVAHHNLENKRQHIEKTSYVFSFALADLIGLKPPPDPRLAILDAPLIKVLYGEDLYNRPPPFLS